MSISSNYTSNSKIKNQNQTNQFNEFVLSAREICFSIIDSKNNETCFTQIPLKKKKRRTIVNKNSNLKTKSTNKESETPIFYLAVLIDKFKKYLLPPSFLNKILELAPEECVFFVYDLLHFYREYQTCELFSSTRQWLFDFKVCCWLLKPELKNYNLEKIRNEFRTLESQKKHHSFSFEMEEDQDQYEKEKLTPKEKEKQEKIEIQKFNNSQTISFPFSILAQSRSQFKKAQVQLFSNVLKMSQIFQTVLGLLAERNYLQLYEGIEFPLINSLFILEFNGIGFDYEEAREGLLNEETAIQELYQDIQRYGFNFDVNNLAQVSNLIFDQLKLQPKTNFISNNVKKENLYSTQESVLSQLVNQHPIVQNILDYRGSLRKIQSLQKLLDSFSNSKRSQQRNRLFSFFTQIGTSTGRLSSTNINFQNIDASIRKYFKPKKGYSFLSIDYSALDLRVLAHLSKEELLIEIMQDKDKDAISEIASMILKKDPKKVTELERKNIKQVLYGTIYGMGFNKTATSLQITPIKAQKLQKNIRNTFPTLHKWLITLKSNSKHNGYTESLLKRKRYFSNNERENNIPNNNNNNNNYNNSKNDDENNNHSSSRKNNFYFDNESNFIESQNQKQINHSRSFYTKLERIIINTTIQATSADIMKLAMLDIHHKIMENSWKNDLQMVCQLHDEFLFEVKNDLIEKASKMVQEVMENVVKFRVPLITKIKIAENWGDC
ncbi:DNA polymerase theta [Anaeramoeba flamelloides]|uniref:DNA polymerase theta n=1 Tax=Anaeramoeba flamelloides TaxID=1746091 RepID=A0AAV7YYK7_9EUKA|nr:DNA polymerase theta [Anaeramoeba flamelloides]